MGVTMAKTELPASRRTEAFDRTVKKITDSVRAQRNRFTEAASKVVVESSVPRNPKNLPRPSGNGKT
jgi:hypothetical protein